MNKTGMLVAGLLLIGSAAFGKGWDKSYIAKLPDGSFASVEAKPGGGKARHLPYRDEAGKVDAAHLRSSLRLWGKVKWENQADAQPALQLLKNEESKLCATGQMTCGQKAKKPKTAKARKPRKHGAPKTAAGGKPASAKPAAPKKLASGPKKPKAPKTKVARKPAPKKAVKPWAKAA